MPLDEQIMMCLAGLCYRGFADLATGEAQVATLARKIDDGLALPLLAGWERVWGPAAYRAPGSIVDDGLVYAVRRHDPAKGWRYVVAVRGTNPMSGFDWLFGDFWTAVQMPWPLATDGAKISFSTALGLATMLRLKSGPPAPHTGLGGFIDQALGTIERAGARVMGAVLPDVEQLRSAIGTAVARVATSPPMQTQAAVEARVRALTEALRAREIEAAVALGRRLVDLHLDRVLFQLLDREPGVRVEVPGGAELLPFLKGAVASHGGDEVDVIVTGHSKGGALAPTLALWLAERQGAEGPVGEQWDAPRNAVVHCYSYAGPTAGNLAFANRSNRILGARCHRYANPFDVVPHAWMREDLRKIPSLYAGTVPPMPVLTDLLAVVDGLTRSLEYTQINTLTAPDASLPGFARKADGTRSVFVDQLIHQHMDAYVQAFGLTQYGITTQTFFQ